MSITYSTGTNTHLTDANKVPITGTFPAVTFTGRPGNSMAVYEVYPSQVVTDGKTVVPETVALTATLVAFDPDALPQGLLVAPR